MISSTAFALAASLLTMPTVAGQVTQSAEFMSGNELYRKCTTREGSATYYQDDAMCIGYIIGVHDGLVTAGSTVTFMANLTTPLRLACTPPGIEAGQLRDIVVNALRAKPAERNLNAGLLIMSALVEAYPCAAS